MTLIHSNFTETVFQINIATIQRIICLLPAKGCLLRANQAN